MFRKSNNSAAAPSASKTPAKTPARKSIPSVVSSDMNVLGNIVSDGIVDFDGVLDGNIRCHSLLLRHNGRINGEVHADSAIIHGKVKGLIKAKAVNLHATSSIEGIIMHETISIEDGAVIDGKFKRMNKQHIASGMPSLSASEDRLSESDIDAMDEDENTSDGSKLMDNIRLIAG